MFFMFRWNRKKRQIKNPLLGGEKILNIVN